jgi:hypothetical protein
MNASMQIQKLGFQVLPKLPPCGCQGQGEHIAPQGNRQSASAEPTLFKRGRGPSVRNLVASWRCGRSALLGAAVAIEDADDVGLQFDNELLDHVLDWLLAIRNLDGAVVFTSVELALHQNMCSLVQPGGELLEALPECDHVVPLGLFFPVFAIVLPGPLCGYREFYDRRAVRQEFDLGIFADESDDRVLIEVHECFPSFCPVAWALKKRVAAAPKPRECFRWGDRNNFSSDVWRAVRALNAKLFWGFHRKQNGRRCRAQGFRPKLCQAIRQDGRNENLSVTSWMRAKVPENVCQNACL